MNITTIPVGHVLTTAKWIKKLAYLIAGIGTVASYGTQVDLLLGYQVGGFSWVIPATIDLLAFCAALALQLPGLDATSRKIAGWVLTVAVVVSVAANVTGGHNLVARLAHAWPVVAYLLGELIANRVRSYAARLAATEAATTAVAMVVKADADAQLAAAMATAARDLADAERRLRAEAADLVAEAERATRAALTAEFEAAQQAEREAKRLAEEQARVLFAAQEAARTTALPIPVSPAPAGPRTVAAAAWRTATVSASVPATPVNPATGQPYSERHARRLRGGK